ncbi:(+)-germacrene D synthase-like [Selaginella moellendorffii]|uniref:(+)-germacrene D synthase-like n=1 Tax=Selaginella moellendorffii TaxID=88036 RepID=UPI000D1C4CA1|nr:(+)-germacrene D synthase-like [Selaginella moellendorffii]|eukprot:XP_024541296.1 (+)-germacrene D synthase-like [Selaginella moellendorffii]
MELSWILILSMNTYIWLREMAEPFIDFMQGLKLAGDASASEIGIHHVMIVNDLFSFRKERATRNYLNIIRPCCGLQSKPGNQQCNCKGDKHDPGAGRGVHTKEERNINGLCVKDGVMEYLAGMEE